MDEAKIIGWADGDYLFRWIVPTYKKGNYLMNKKYVTEKNS